MTYLIRRKDPVQTEIKRILGEQNLRAQTLLRGWQKNPRDNVHLARQAIKRIRALLRLIRPGAPYVYRVENTFYRDIGRSLAYARDTEAVIEALGLLQPRIQGPLARHSLDMLRTGLEQRAVRERECALHDFPGRIDQARQALAAGEKRLRHLPAAQVRRKDLRRGVEATLQRCRAAFEKVRHTQAPDDFHAWRKDVKYAYHQSRLMEQLMPKWSSTSGPGLGELADILGHLHDLVMLETVLKPYADELNVDVHLRSIRKAIGVAAGEYADEALRRGESMGGVPPPHEAFTEAQSRA